MNLSKFLKLNELDSNLVGTNEVLNCMNNKIKLIYSATSASLGNKGKDKNLSPYAFTKANGLTLNSRLFIFIMFMAQIK